MSVSVEQLEQWMIESEGEHLEFKAARQTFNREELIKYCAALANEGGGKIIFGVSDKKPRQVVGTQYSTLDQAKADTLGKLRIRVDIDEVLHPQGRVLVFHVPPRPLGVALAVDGAYWMRSGESLTQMSWDMLARI
jgi:ATP-dependent DNA helicase RecG